MNPAALSRAFLLVASLLALGAARADDPFLEPQVLPPNLKQLNMNSSETGEEFVIRLDDDHLPLKEDFEGDQASIPCWTKP